MIDGPRHLLQQPSARHGANRGRSGGGAASTAGLHAPDGAGWTTRPAMPRLRLA